MLHVIAQLVLITRQHKKKRGAAHARTHTSSHNRMFVAEKET